jgi:hypothetical protein
MVKNWETQKIIITWQLKLLEHMQHMACKIVKRSTSALCMRETGKEEKRIKKSVWCLLLAIPTTLRRRHVINGSECKEVRVGYLSCCSSFIYNSNRDVCINIQWKTNCSLTRSEPPTLVLNIYMRETRNDRLFWL